MRTYKDDIYFGFMETKMKKYKGKIARICDGYYFSMFLKINDTSYFDLEDDKLYNENDIFITGKLDTHGLEYSEKKLKKRLTLELCQKQ